MVGYRVVPRGPSKATLIVDLVHSDMKVPSCASLYVQTNSRNTLYRTMLEFPTSKISTRPKNVVLRKSSGAYRGSVLVQMAGLPKNETAQVVAVQKSESGDVVKELHGEVSYGGMGETMRYLNIVLTNNHVPEDVQMWLRVENAGGDSIEIPMGVKN